MTSPENGPISVGARNPGPSWGYSFLRLADKVLPEVVFQPVRALGTAVASAAMVRQRRCSREYLRVVLGREPRWLDVFRHFFAFEECFMLRLRVANGRPYPCRIREGNQDFCQWYDQGGAVLLGTFHVGVSDLLGFQLGGVNKGRIHLVRQRVGNSEDTERLSARFGAAVHFIWINQPSEMLFALKEAAATDDAIALQCDRLEFSARNEAFQFLGARRIFPFTIYHLSIIFRRPVILSVGLPENGCSHLYSSPKYVPDPGERREEALARAREHFQAFLFRLDELLRAQPYQWFNFLPLNPEEPSTS